MDNRMQTVYSHGLNKGYSSKLQEYYYIEQVHVSLTKPVYNNKIPHLRN